MESFPRANIAESVEKLSPSEDLNHGKRQNTRSHHDRAFSLHSPLSASDLRRMLGRWTAVVPRSGYGKHSPIQTDARVVWAVCDDLWASQIALVPLTDRGHRGSGGIFGRDRLGGLPFHRGRDSTDAVAKGCRDRG